MSEKANWWKEGVIYQVYPRSFQDSNGDGIGDIRGIINRLDYLESLNIDILWLGPCFKSPNDDNGYDVSDYCDIMDEFGTMADLDELLEGLHKRGIKLLLDMVFNHSSDEHKWFEESRKSKDNPYRDYYIWRPAKPNGDPPTNWKSIFGGSTWEYDKETDEYYLHIFTRKQPDLNWENPKVRKELADVCKFWLDKGVDGFRMDVITFISKSYPLQDTEIEDFATVLEKVYASGPRIHEYLKELNQNVLSKYDCMTVGEGPGITTENANDYVGSDRDELSMVFALEHMFYDNGVGGKFDIIPKKLSSLKNFFNTWDKALGDRGWNTVFLDNHDFPRMVSRYAEDKCYRVTSEKMLLTMLLTLRGTPSIYQGSEIAMTNVAFESFDDYRDVETANILKEWQEAGKSEEEFLKLVHIQGRDNVRTPMQWNTEKNAGFSKSTPWIKLNPNYSYINVAEAEADRDSVLHFFRKLTALRKQHSTWVYGAYNELSTGSEALFVYTRKDENGAYIILLNFTGEVQEFTTKLSPQSVLVNNYKDLPYKNARYELQPWQGAVVKLENAV